MKIEYNIAREKIAGIDYTSIPIYDISKTIERSRLSYP